MSLNFFVEAILTFYILSDLNPELYCSFIHECNCFFDFRTFVTVFGAVSYTHLDVYKRQAAHCWTNLGACREGE